MKKRQRKSRKGECHCIEPDELDAYRRFRTGMSFSEVFHMLRVSSDDPKDWHVGITRHTVLGKWHQIKLTMWEQMKYSFGGVPHPEEEEEIPF